MAETQTSPSAADVQPTGYLPPPEPQPWRALIDVGIMRLNTQQGPAPGSNVVDHTRYKLTGFGWALLLGGGWWLLNRRRGGP